MKEFVNNDEKLNIVNEIKMLSKEDQYINASIKELKKDFPNEKSEEALKNYITENDLNFLKTEFFDKWKYQNKKLAFPNECFNSIDDYQKPVDNLTKQNFFSKSKNAYPSYEETERTKQPIKIFNLKNGEELTKLYLKSDAILPT